MSTLRQYHNGEFEIDSSDFIFIDKFESLFNVLHDDDKILRFSPIRENTKDELLKIFELAKDREKITILASNPDTDMPCIKKEYLLQDNIPYSEELQKKFDNLDITHFLENDILEKIPENVLIYCHSVIKTNEHIRMIPLGRDFKGREVINSEKFIMSEDRNTLCYYNCSIPPETIHWYGRIRAYIYDSSRHKDFIHCENINTVGLRNFDSVGFSSYYNNLARSKFMICPRGCGLDTYRMWDCLYLGCIPIVVKYEGYKDFEDLPILFVDKWEDYLSLSKNYLNSKYDEILDTNFNYDKLKFSYWENLIRTSTAI